MKKLQWSTVDIPPDAVAAWTARAIYRPDSIGRPLDLLPDRQDMDGTKEGKNALKALMNLTHLGTYQRKVGKARPTDGSGEWVEYEAEGEGHRLFIKGSPLSSYGYFYVTAWVVPL